MDIKRAFNIKARVYSQENIAKAEEKCIEARSCIGNALASDNPEQYLLRAVDFYLEALDIYSGLSEPYLAIAEICSQFGQFSDAIGLVKKVLDTDPRHPQALKMLEIFKYEADHQNDYKNQSSDSESKVTSEKIRSVKRLVTSGSEPKVKKELAEVNSFNFNLSRISNIKKDNY